MEFKIFSDQRGRYLIVSEGKRSFTFEFPTNATVGENYEIVSFLKEEIWKAMESKRKKDSESKDSGKTGNTEEMPKKQPNETVKNPEPVK